MVAYLHTQKRKRRGEKVVEITSPEELEGWLEDKPKEWVQAIAFR